MPKCEILETFPVFLDLWSKENYNSINDQIDLWHHKYMAHWPELLQKQLEDYASLQEDWRKTAEERIFPALTNRLPLLQSARNNLLGICEDVFDRCKNSIDFDEDIICVIYVGIGSGAGWATIYNNKPAILFGLENIVEEGWQNKETLSGLMAHELGHLIHFAWRREANLEPEDTVWWQLYAEGFAQWSEHTILGKQTWHMQSKSNNLWLRWCNENLGWLASEFLDRADHLRDMRQFFGSWYELQGFKQTGYFLGHELINRLLDQFNLKEIALIDKCEAVFRPLLEKIAQED